MRLVARLFAMLMIAGLALVGLAVAPAGAQLAAHNPSFVGTYKFHLTIEGTNIKPFNAQINADGTAVAAQTAHWTSKGKTITIVFKNSTVMQTFIGTLSKKGIGSKKKPGSYADNMGNAGTWYAVRTG